MKHIRIFTLKYFLNFTLNLHPVTPFPINKSIFTETSVLEYYHFSCFKYGVCISSTTYCNFSVPVFCSCQISSFWFRSLEKKDLKHKKTILDLDLLIYNRQNCVFLKSLQFKVSNKPLRTSKAYIFYQKRLFNQEVNNKQKASKILQE